MSNSISSPSGLPHVQQELLLGGEELPVEEVLELPPVDRDELGARLEAELVGDRFRLYSGDLDHGHQSRRAAKDRRSGPGKFKTCGHFTDYGRK